MTALLLVLLFALLSLGLCLAALEMQRRHGLVPLVLALTVLESIKYFVAAYVLVPLPGLGHASLGSLVGYVNVLVVVQACYLRLGAAPARQLAVGLVLFSFLAGVLSALLAQLIAQPGVLSMAPLERYQLSLSGWVLVYGNVLMLLGLVGSLVLMQWLLRRGWPLPLAMVGSLVLVMLVDTLVFQLSTRDWAEISASLLLANAAGKSLMAALLGALTAWWLGDRGPRDGPAALDLLRALSFRTRLEALELELQTDALTRLFNRRYLERQVPDVLRLDRQRGHSTALVLLDLDHFKGLNDSLGHLVGDQALRHVAQLLQQGVRHHDSVVRYGGEEFLLVLPGTGAQEAAHLAAQLLQTLRERPLQLEGERRVALSATAGVAAAPQDGLHWTELLQRADERLYRGKREGRDRVVGAAESSASPPSSLRPS